MVAGTFPGSRCRGRVACLPADDFAADLLVGDAVVEGNLACEGVEGLRGGADSALVAQARGQLGEDLPSRLNLARPRDTWAQALEAAVGMGDGTLLLGVTL